MTSNAEGASGSRLAPIASRSPGMNCAAVPTEKGSAIMLAALEAACVSWNLGMAPSLWDCRDPAIHQLRILASHCGATVGPGLVERLLDVALDP